MVPKDYRSLGEVFASDEQGLLDTASPGPTTPSPESRLASSLEAVNAFVDQHGREPSPEGDLDEERLARRLASFRQRTGEEWATLTAHDRHGLLTKGATSAPTPDGDEPAATDPEPEKEAPASKEGADQEGPAGEVTSLEDIFAADDGLLETPAPEIQEARHVSFETNDRVGPEEVAQREPCPDFWRFEPLFEEIQSELRTGKSQTQRFQENGRIEVGEFFILDGMLCLVDAITQPDESQGGRYNPRIRVVFSNGTEANMLMRSLARALRKDSQGRRVMLDPDRAIEGMQGVSHHDHRQGTIYILRSLRDDPELEALGELYKIGYTEDDLQQRIAGAEKSPTYLEAPVEVVLTYECYNVDPYTIERLIHAVLAPFKLNVTLQDSNGQRYRPQEWFAVPKETAQAVVERIADGTIHQYRLDTINRQLVEKGRRYS